MPLALSLPAVEARPTHPPETRPARVAPWLEETLKRDPIDAASTMGDALAATNRVALSETRRLELAERYYASSLVLWPHLERHFTRAQHPLTGNALTAAKAALTLASELATAYKHLLSHEADRRLILSGNRQLIALIHRCLQCTNRILINSYQSYAPVPARTWHDAHAIYVFAHGRNLQMTPVGSDSAEATPERYYVQALLLALANPYGFTPGQLGQVVQYLQAHAHWARITDVPPVHRLAKAVAIIPVGHDFPPFAANKGANVNGGKLFLLTFDLAFQIQEQLRALEAGGAVPAAAGAAPTAKADYMTLLRRLLRQWAIPPARQFNRLPSRARVVMCAGLPAVWQYSRGTRPDLPGAVPGLPAMNTCQVINHTPAGYALRQVETAHAALRIGDLIALRVEGRNALQVAMVRWFRNTLRGSGLEFGCELLSDNPQAAAAHAEEGAKAPVPAVVLPGEGEEGAPAMVLLPAGAFETEQAITLKFGERADTAVLTKLVEQGPGFQLYEYVAVA